MNGDGNNDVPGFVVPAEASPVAALVLASARKTSVLVTMLAQAITTPAALAVTSVQLLLVFLTMISSVSSVLDFFLWLLARSVLVPALGPVSMLSSTWPRSAEVEWRPVTESDEGMFVKQRGRLVSTERRQSIPGPD